MNADYTDKNLKIRAIREVRSAINKKICKNPQIWH